MCLATVPIYQGRNLRGGVIYAILVYTGEPWHKKRHILHPSRMDAVIRNHNVFFNMIEHITSLQNPRVKRFMRLRDKSSARRTAGVFCVE